MKSTRSITLPLESNPIMLKITSELDKLKTWEESSTTTAETISIGLSGITDLYKCIGDFLGLPFIQQSLSLFHKDKCLMELLDGIGKVLDICNASRDLTLQMQEASRNLAGSLKGKNSKASSTSAFFSFRKQLIKSVKKTLLSLKGVECESFSSSLTMFDNERHGISSVIKVLTCVSIISISILEALLFFLATSVSKCKPGRFSFLSKLMSRSKVACESQSADQRMNELINLNSALFALQSQDTTYEMNVQAACKRLSSLDVGLEGIMNGSDSMSKQLTQTRSILLNIIP